MRKNTVQAWKLPAFALFYILVSYMADMLSHALHQDLYRGYPSEWLYQLWHSYVHMWFDGYALFSAPAWVLFHAGLLFTCRHYYRSGLPIWGWGVALFVLLCSSTGGYGTDITFLLLESL